MKRCLEIAAHQLKQQRAALDQVVREMTARNCHPTSGYYVEQACGLFKVVEVVVGKRSVVGPTTSTAHHLGQAEACPT